jgi:beta-lactamase class A
MIDLGVSIPLPENGGTHADFFSAKSYAAIFRMLYNASYLSIGQSEEVLELLSRSTFTKGLVAGVPPGTKVAHKFGEATQVDQDSGKIVKRELHDCGVIYKEKSSYILCVMTEGSDFDSLENIIASISRITWDTSELTDESE